MGAHLHRHKLLALAVFVDSLKTAYVRSVHVLEEHVGSLFAIQQDFLFDPGKYKRVNGPLMLGSFHAFLASVGMQQSIAAIIKMQQNEGWHCLLEYRNDAPSETSLPHILSPSKNVDLKNVPSLEQDLKTVENAVLSCIGGALASSRSFEKDGKRMTPLKEYSFVWPTPRVSVSSTSVTSFSDHSSDHMPALETPKRTLNSQEFDARHNWSSDLELASPKTSLRSTSLLDQGHNFGSSWNPTMMLDLNLDLREFATQDGEPDCALLLSVPVANPQALLNLELGTQFSSLQQSIATDDSTDSFADSSSSYKNVGVSMHASSLVKFNAMQNAGYVCSEDSAGCYGSVINMSSSEANGNSSTTSSAVYSPYEKSRSESFNMDVNVTYGNLYSNACYKNAGDKRQGKRRCKKACSSGSTESVQQWMCNMDAFKSKPRSVRPGSTSERITEITLQELAQYFSMPITQAAKRVNVGLTVLKKRCREFGIPRWPHRKMKSINSLIDNVKDLAEDQGVRSSQRVLNTVRELEEQKKLMEEMPGVELAERTKKLRQACFKANYKKRRLGMMEDNNNNVLHTPAASVLPLSSPALRPFGIMDLNPGFSTISTPRSCLSKDHFL